MKLKKGSIKSVSILVVSFLSMQQTACLAPVSLKKEQVQAKFNQKLLELRDLLNEQKDKLSDPAVWQNVLNLIRILIPLGAFALAGYASYKKTFGDEPPFAQTKGVTATPWGTPVVTPKPIQPITASPSYNVAMFFRKIESLTPSALSYLDVVIPDLEKEFGLVSTIRMNGFSLLSAAIDANRLDTFNKVELIRWLKNHGVLATPGDIQKAQRAGNERIIDAVLN